MMTTNQRLPRVYFAGKVHMFFNDWRSQIVGGVWDLHPVTDDFLLANPLDGPLPPRQIGSLCVYTGPFFARNDHGSAHGPGSHGVDAALLRKRREAGVDEWEVELDAFYDCSMDSKWPDDKRRDATARNSLAGIDAADFVFAWLGDDDADTAYGTLVEIGYAVGKGIPVYVAVKSGTGLPDEMWFAASATKRGPGYYDGVIYAPNPAAAFNRALVNWGAR